MSGRRSVFALLLALTLCSPALAQKTALEFLDQHLKNAPADAAAK